jgi:hypothetical protein
MKGAAGKYMEDAWVPFAFAGVNLVASIILAKYMGVAGVFLGTIIGSLCTADWYRPIVIYKHVFNTSVTKYYQRYLLYVGLGLVGIVTAPEFVPALNWANLLELMPIAGALMLMFSVFAKDEQTLRKFLLANALIWTVYTAIIGSTVFFTDLAAAVSTASALYKYRNRK